MVKSAIELFVDTPPEQGVFFIKEGICKCFKIAIQSIIIRINGTVAHGNIDAGFTVIIARSAIGAGIRIDIFLT